MKKKLCSIVCLCYFVSIMLCACGRKEQGNPIRLPAREDIVSIGVSDGDKYAMSPNTEGEATKFIDEFLSMLTEDNQSNFGSGFDYQYGADDTIEIYMNEKWFVFEYREESE